MSWQERDYSPNDSQPGRWAQRLRAKLVGSVPLGRWWGIRVRVHSSLIIFIAFTNLLFPIGSPYGYLEAVKYALTGTALLFGIVLLHEFGHCFAARCVGGSPTDILLWPLGGLATSQVPHNWFASFITAAGGPLVNVLICLLAGAALAIFAGPSAIPWNPIHPHLASLSIQHGVVLFYVWWLFTVSYILLLFNLLPIFPLDGGQLTQALLWRRLGYVRSMLIACRTGMIGAVIAGIFGLITLQLGLSVLAILGFMTCRQRRLLTLEAPELVGSFDFMGGGEQAYAYSGGSGYGSSLHEAPEKRRHISGRTARRLRRRQQQEQAERAHIDRILAKVSASGMTSLNWRERRALRNATRREREF